MSGLRDPDFHLDREVILRSSAGLAMSDSTLGLTTKANVILLSYNRPNMLREAIDSVLNSTYENLNLWIADDGSDFDVREVVEDYKDNRILWFQREKMSLEERCLKSRIAENINNVLDIIPDEEMVYYICDDDILDVNWITRSISCIEHSPNAHIVSGESFYFFDGQNPYEESKQGLPFSIDHTSAEDPSMIPRLWWGLGSFTHKALCYRQEGIRWFDSIYGHSIDTNFIADLWEVHQNYLIIDKPAVYRREHKNMLSAKLGRKDNEGNYHVGYIPPPLKPEMIEGMME